MTPRIVGKCYIALPAINESAYLPAALDSIARQTHRPARVFICVNQPDAWWQEVGEKKDICFDNRKTLYWLNSFHDLDIEIIDRSSPGLGWQGKQAGAGWARKVAMDAINLTADERDIMVSMDADTRYEPDYLHAVQRAFSSNRDAVALSAPFYHRLGPSDQENRALIHYELYMRHYFLNLVRIHSPYAFIALGSAIALPVRSYRKIRGITPFKAGEDFYFLQKLRKMGRILNHCDAVVYPSARISSRAGFGTGPAIRKGLDSGDNAYPLFHEAFFDKISETYRLFPQLYNQNVPTPMDAFLDRQFGTAAIWDPLRRNFKTQDHFIRACHEKIDGLRILQYLKFCTNHDHGKGTDEDIFAGFVKANIPELAESITTFSFSSSTVAELDELRNLVFQYELAVRKRMA